jgi:hypothetical protein
MKYFKWGFNSHELPLPAQEPREMPGLYFDEKKLIYIYIYIYIWFNEVEDKEKKAQVCRFCSSGADLRGGLFFKRLQICQGKFWSTEPGVRTVEDTVRTVIGPVYDKFHDVPFQLLKFVDHKVSFSFLQFQIYFATGQLITSYIT